MMEDVGEFTIRGNRMRTEVLQLYARIQAITDGYDGVEGYLGESFCEDEFGMIKAGPGTKDVDGHVGKIAVQSKFKWLTPENFKTRYVSIRKEPGFDVLIVTYAESGESNVRLFGSWTREQVLSKAKPAQSSLRVFLKDLKTLPTFWMPRHQEIP